MRLDSRASSDARARVHGAGLVTTEKDWVRLPIDWRARIIPWPVRARFDDPAALERYRELQARRRALEAASSAS